jgi:3-methyladenine DNA glycosylase AlkC
MRDLKKLELKERIVCITKALESQLPKDFEKAAEILIAALPEPLDPNKTDDDFGDFIFAPYGEYVVRNGLSKKHLKTSLETLKEITQRFSMEDAIRYFLNTFERETMTELQKWTHHSNYHVRRLTSEGTRPLLPWSGRIGLAAEDTLPLLDELYFDTTRYVTRSVANHMNDIAKADPKLAVKTLKRWKREGKQAEKEMDWMISHSLRTLVKQGNKEALLLLGYHHEPAITVERFSLSKTSEKIAPGDVLEFSFDVVAKKDEPLMIDYSIDFMKAISKSI